ncbi:MAG: histone-lysine N-methyltransferase [Eggerthellaceae bacterium]|nr:histone-lysine N-methyltransferase [Eggerthellaceae bacterium]
MPRHRRDDQNRFDADEGNAIGLTRAFSPIEDDEFVDADAMHGALDPFETVPAPVPEPPLDAEELTAADVERAKSRKAKHARHAKPSAGSPTAADAASPADAGADATNGAGQGSSAPSFTAFSDEASFAADETPAYLHKSKRMRRILLVVIAILLVLLVAGGVAVWQLLQVAQTAASQQAQNVTQEVGAIEGDEAKDASTATAKTTTVPDLVSLLGLTQDEAVAQLAHGAQVTSTREVNEEGNPIKQDVRVVLSAEPADSRSGTPTVYLGIDEEGHIVQAGYSTSTSSLGYGSLSFTDAVLNESVIEKTLSEAGLSVEEGTVSLPEDKTAYTTYASDGATKTKEYCSFEGEAQANGGAHAWSAVLSYDYAMANATGNLADTIRTIYVYVNA